MAKKSIRSCARCGYKLPEKVTAELVMRKCIKCAEDCCPVCGPPRDGAMCKKCAMESLMTEFAPLA